MSLHDVVWDRRIDSNVLDLGVCHRPVFQSLGSLYVKGGHTDESERDPLCSDEAFSGALRVYTECRKLCRNRLPAALQAWAGYGQRNKLEVPTR